MSEELLVVSQILAFSPFSNVTYYQNKEVPNTTLISGEYWMNRHHEFSSSELKKNEFFFDNLSWTVVKKFKYVCLISNPSAILESFIFQNSEYFAKMWYLVRLNNFFPQ